MTTPGVLHVPHPGQTRAWDAVGMALKYGKLKRESCSTCGALGAQAHHEDYRQPLAVMWLCRRCHGQRHRELRRAGVVIPLPESTKQHSAPVGEAPVRLAGETSGEQLTVTEVARTLGVTRQAILRAIKLGTLPARQVEVQGQRPIWLVDANEVTVYRLSRHRPHSTPTEEQP